MKVLMIIALIAPVAAKPTWSTSSPELNRRLEIAVGASHKDTNDAGCIVGGYDTDSPNKVYVGGPCSELETKNGQPSPTANFRYVMMASVAIDLVATDDAGENPQTVSMKPIAGKELVHFMEHDSHFEVGISSPFVFEGNDKAPKAALFASTTSYLSKASFGYTKNLFVVGKDKDSGDFEGMGVCVTPCKDANGAYSACADSKCPTTELTATPGQYKYSILAAAFDLTEGTTAYIPGADGNGWERLVKEYGGADKKLNGWFRVYQVVDFTELKADTLEVTAADGTGKVMFADMKECKETDKMEDCFAKVAGAATPLAVGSVTVTSDTWAGSYSFPQYYNRGQWEMKAKAATRRMAGEAGTTTDCTTSDAAKLTAACKCATTATENECAVDKYCWADNTCKDAAKAEKTAKVNNVATTTPIDSKAVKIHMIKFAPELMVTHNLAKDVAEAKLKKMALLVYHFDISGVDAEKDKGKFMVYDPTISTVKSSTTTAAKTKVQGSVNMALTLPAGQTPAQFVADPQVKKGVADALEEQYTYPAGSVKDVVLTVVTARRLATQRELAATTFKVDYTVEASAADVKAIEDKMKKTLTAADKTAFATILKTKIDKATSKTYTVEVTKAAHEGTVTPTTTAKAGSASFARSSAEPAFLFAMVIAIAYAGL